MKYIVLAFLCFLIWPGRAQQKEIHLQATIPGYASDSIVFYANTNFFTHEKKLLAKTKVSDSGTLDLSFGVDECLEIISPLGVYTGHLFVEPGKSYHLFFPPKTEKTEREQLNPYFEPVDFYFGIENDTGVSLNNSIPALLDTISAFYKSNYKLFLTRKGLNKAIEDFTTQLISFSAELDSKPFWANYKKYASAEILFSADLIGWVELSKSYFEGQKKIMNNPAYVNLFNQAYSGIFNKLIELGHKNDLELFFSEQLSYKDLLVKLEQMDGLKDEELLHLIFLKNIQEDYFKGKIDADFSIKICRQIIQMSNLELVKQCAGAIRMKIQHLLSGTPAPDFKLYSSDSTLHSLMEYRGKYLYLVFCQENNFACENEYDLLNKVQKRFKKQLEIVVIDAGLNFNQYMNEMLDAGYKWSYLHYKNQPEVLKNYNVRVFPTTVLIDPYGQIISAPALLPSKGFESDFQLILNKRD